MAVHRSRAQTGKFDFSERVCGHETNEDVTTHLDGNYVWLRPLISPA